MKNICDLSLYPTSNERIDRALVWFVLNEAFWAELFSRTTFIQRKRKAGS